MYQTVQLDKKSTVKIALLMEQTDDGVERSVYHPETDSNFYNCARRLATFQFTGHDSTICLSGAGNQNDVVRFSAHY